MKFLVFLLLAGLSCVAQKRQPAGENDAAQADSMVQKAIAGKVGGQRTGQITTQPKHKPFFGYSGELGPEHWAGLDEKWTLCGEGASQSPINITFAETQPTEGPALTFDYSASTLSVSNNGHTIQFNYSAGSLLRIGDREFNLLQFHFHTPSEHRFENGAVFDLEMHLVHRDHKGNLAVIGVLMVPSEQLGAASFPFLNAEDFAQLLPRAAGVAYFFDDEIDVTGLIPHDHATYRYSGSLTTPPCSEDVSWFVMREPLQVNAEEVAILKSALHSLEFAGDEGGNNRPVQPLNGRSVKIVQ